MILFLMPCYVYLSHICLRAFVTYIKTLCYVLLVTSKNVILSRPSISQFLLPAACQLSDPRRPNTIYELLVNKQAYYIDCKVLGV